MMLKTTAPMGRLLLDRGPQRMAAWQASSLRPDVIFCRWTPNAWELMISLSSIGDESQHANDRIVSKPKDDALGELSGRCWNPTRAAALQMCAIG